MSKNRVKAGTSKAQATMRRALFVEAMLTNGGNQTQAAISAGFPPKSAHVRGAELVKDSKVAALLEKRLGEALAKSKLTADETLQSVARDVRFDPAKLYNEDGSMKKIHEMDLDTRLCLRALEVDEIAVGKGAERQVIGHTVKAKFPEKTTAREQAMKHFGLYEKDNQQKPQMPPPVFNIVGVAPAATRR